MLHKNIIIVLFNDISGLKLGRVFIISKFGIKLCSQTKVIVVIISIAKILSGISKNFKS